MFDYTVSDIFSFEKRDVTRHMMYDLHLGDKVKDAFNYLQKKIGVQKLPADLSKLKWSKGKNYNWAFVKQDAVTFAFRQYHDHYTIFVKKEKDNNEYRTRYGIFTFHTDRDKLKTDKEMDQRCEDWFFDLNKHIKTLFEMAANDRLHLLWNNVSFKREDYIDVKVVWTGSEDDVSDIDLFNFACEEIFQKFLEIFSETDMFEAVSKIRVGQKLGEYEVTSVRKAVKDGYYHAVGISWKNTREEQFNDVYRLTRWHFKEIFPKGFMLGM